MLLSSRVLKEMSGLGFAATELSGIRGIFLWTDSLRWRVDIDHSCGSADVGHCRRSLYGCLACENPRPSALTSPRNAYSPGYFPKGSFVGAISVVSRGSRRGRQAVFPEGRVPPERESGR